MSVISEMTPGKDRLAAVATTYLDGCLRDRGVKALLLEARGHLPIANEVTRGNPMNVDVVAAAFQALGAQHPREAARLWIAATAECALMELELGRRDPAARSALRGPVRCATGPATWTALRCHRHCRRQPGSRRDGRAASPTAWRRL